MANSYSYPVERGKFIEVLRSEGIPEIVSLAILRSANTIQRLAVAMCNGDWPCDNGERTVIECPQCGSSYVPSTIKRTIGLVREGQFLALGKGISAKACPDCRAAAQICAKLKDYPGVCVIFGGDPRGCCVKLAVPSGKTDDWGHEGICVPTRDY